MVYSDSASYINTSSASTPRPIRNALKGPQRGDSDFTCKLMTGVGAMTRENVFAHEGASLVKSTQTALIGLLTNKFQHFI